jgi:hypothetical protein
MDADNVPHACPRRPLSFLNRGGFFRRESIGFGSDSVAGARSQTGHSHGDQLDVLLPLLVIALAAAFPRLETVWLGAILAMLSFATGLAVNCLAPPWDIALLVRSVPAVLVQPALVMACWPPCRHDRAAATETPHRQMSFNEDFSART